MSFENVLRAGLIAGLGLGLGLLPIAALAQTSTAPETGAQPGAETPVGATYTAETHGDWEIRCIRAEAGMPEPCQLYQLLLDNSGGAVAEFNIFDLPDEGALVAGATIVTPLDTLLTPGLRLRIDDGPWLDYPFSFCQQIGCFAQIGLTAENLDGMRRGTTAFVALVPLPAPDQIIELDASLRGFTAGFAALMVRHEAALALMEQLDAEAGAPAQ
jgi:invasion protein IalB